MLGVKFMSVVICGINRGTFGNEVILGYTDS